MAGRAVAMCVHRFTNLKAPTAETGTWGERTGGTGAGAWRARAGGTTYAGIPAPPAPAPPRATPTGGAPAPTKPRFTQRGTERRRLHGFGSSDNFFVHQMRFVHNGQASTRHRTRHATRGNAAANAHDAQPPHPRNRPTPARISTDPERLRGHAPTRPRPAGR